LSHSPSPHHLLLIHRFFHRGTLVLHLSLIGDETTYGSAVVSLGLSTPSTQYYCVLSSALVFNLCSTGPWLPRPTSLAVRGLSLWGPGLHPNCNYAPRFYLFYLALWVRVHF
jgi:hypothetical protein